MSEPRIAVVSAGLGDPSSTKLLADRLRDATLSALTGHGQTAEAVDVVLRPLAQDIAAHMLTHNPSEALAAAIREVVDAEAIIAVTPTFNMSYSGLFKSFFDVIEEGQLASIPTALGATGGSARHSMVMDTAMRPMFAYLKAQVVPTGVFAASEDWGTASGLERRIARAGQELADLMVAMPRRREADPFDVESDAFVSFEQMLGHA
ncbi:CE1759 family FMN reductase [Agrococcus sp. TF02-05]|uniref:CE1759 family FMN reductase n=1 Tax=Agrococcus sp. TF02-05 TaxID=2815211 RepID=UPI001AA14680|nr:CE1759 family FMN reductase [Agrococcus sp. TF02-05]MBO1770945.1 NAD(P)H-dependent oxidoreductase [Agrococcus sp. TF02-05]